MFRAMTVLGCSLISWAGASNLDGFVSFIGSFAWSVPFHSFLLKQYTDTIVPIQRSPLLHLPTITAPPRPSKDEDATRSRLCFARFRSRYDGVHERSDDLGLVEAG
jgi:hypothetical protein